MSKGNRIKNNKKQQTELTDTQKNINKIRKRMNRRDLEEVKYNGFSKEKMYTYLWIFLLPPYGLYRLYNKKNGFLYEQKVVWTIVAVVYVLYYISNFLN